MKPVVFSRFCTLRDLLTPGQRAYAKVAYDGLDPADLTGPERDLARQIWGNVERMPQSVRRVLVQVKGRDVAGTRLGAERCLHLGYTLPLDRIGPEELAYVVFGGPKIRHARVGLRFALNASRANRIKVEDETHDGFTIVRHDRRRVRFECFAASRGGDTARGVPIIAALLDEAAFYFDEASGVVNAETIFSAMVPRLLPGGQILIVSSPWAESGLLFNEFTANHGHPVTAIAAFCPTLVMRDDAETIAMVERETIRNPANANREMGANFLSRHAGAFFDSTARKLAVDEIRPSVVMSPRTVARSMAVDLGFTRNSSAACAVFERPSKEGFYVVAEIIELKPTLDGPLKPTDVYAAFAALARRHAIDGILCDQHYLESLREFVTGFRIGVYTLPSGSAGKEEQFVAMRNVLHEGRINLPNHQKLLSQLSEVAVRPSAGGGLHITQPQKRSGEHGDLVSALVGAVWALEVARMHPPALSRADYSNLPNFHSSTAAPLFR